MTSARAKSFRTDFSIDPGGTYLGIAEIEEGVLKLTDLADLPPADPPKPYPQHGSYILPDFNTGALIAGFTADFNVAVGGGSSLGAQGFSFALAEAFPTFLPFREGGGSSRGLVISFDTLDNLAGFGAEGNDPGDAPGIIVKMGGIKLAARSFLGIQTYPPGSTATRFAPVRVQVRSDGTLDVIYDGVSVYDRLPIGFVPMAGVFGFGAGTADQSAATRNNHWIDDLRITTETLAEAAVQVSSKSPSGLSASPDAPVIVTLANLGTSSVRMTFDGREVVPQVNRDGIFQTMTYEPPGLLPSGTTHLVELTYGTDRRFTYAFTVAPYLTIPATARSRPGSVRTDSNGFRTRVYQVTAPVPGTLAGAERQLAGLAGPNIANTIGADAQGDFTLLTVNFDDDQRGTGEFLYDEPIPGYPGIGSDGSEVTDNVVIESLAYLELPAGPVSLAVTSDDGFRLSLGNDPRDVTAMTIASSERASTTVARFVVEEAGIYPVRLMWFDNSGDAHCEFFSVNRDGQHVLVNDRSSPGNIRAFRDRTEASPPYIRSARPGPEENGVNPELDVEIILVEDEVQVMPDSIRLSIADSPLHPTVNRSGGQMVIRYRHAGQVPQGTYPLALAFTDATGRSVTNSWRFTTLPGACEQTSGARVTGHWTFDEQSLKATVGENLQYIEESLAETYPFGTSGQGPYAQVPGINGEPVRFLVIPRTVKGDDFRRTGLRVKPGLAASGGGVNANVWTLIMDLYWGDGPGNGTVLRTHDLNQPDDGDLFWRTVDGAYGKACCSDYDGINPLYSHPQYTWARVVFVADLTATPRRFAKYINGVKHRDDVSGDGANVDGRFSLPEEIFLFNDGDDNETSDAFVNAIQFREGALRDEEVAALGGPTALGPPLVIPGAGVCAPLAPAASNVQLFSSDRLNGEFSADTGAEVDLATRQIAVPAPSDTRYFQIRGSLAFRISSVVFREGKLVLAYN